MSRSYLKKDLGRYVKELYFGGSVSLYFLRKYAYNPYFSKEAESDAAGTNTKELPISIDNDPLEGYIPFDVGGGQSLYSGSLYSSGVSEENIPFVEEIYFKRNVLGEGVPLELEKTLIGSSSYSDDLIPVEHCAITSEERLDFFLDSLFENFVDKSYTLRVSCLLNEQTIAILDKKKELYLNFKLIKEPYCVAPIVGKPIPFDLLESPVNLGYIEGFKGDFFSAEQVLYLLRLYCILGGLYTKVNSRSLYNREGSVVIEDMYYHFKNDFVYIFKYLSFVLKGSIPVVDLVDLCVFYLPKVIEELEIKNDLLPILRTI